MATPYRDDERALRQRLSALDAQLRDARAWPERRRELDEARERLEAERAEIAGRLSALDEGFSLEGLRIASPCKADWGAMAGDDRVRYCGQCQKNVYNLSGMPRDEAEALVQGAEGRVCVRMYRRADGTVLTADCPEGVSRKRRRRLAIVAGSGAMAAASAVAYGAFGVTMGAPPPITMGELVATPAAPPTSFEVPTQIEAPANGGGKGPVEPRPHDVEEMGDVTAVMGEAPPLPPPAARGAKPRPKHGPGGR